MSDAESFQMIPKEDFKEDFTVDYENLFMSTYDPLKDTIRYLMNRMKAQDKLIKELGTKGKKWKSKTKEKQQWFEKDVKDGL